MQIERERTSEERRAKREERRERESEKRSETKTGCTWCVDTERADFACCARNQQIDKNQIVQKYGLSYTCGFVREKEKCVHPRWVAIATAIDSWMQALILIPKASAFALSKHTWLGFFGVCRFALFARVPKIFLFIRQFHNILLNAVWCFNQPIHLD